jgi:hypothetical protein
VAYKNSIAEWMNAEMTEKETAIIKGVCETVFKRAGGRGEMGPVGTKNILKGELGFDASRFTAGNVEAGDDETVNTARGWVEYILAAAPGAARDAAIEQMKADNAGVPEFIKLVARMIMATQDKPKPAPAPKAAPKAAPAPAPAMHSVKAVKGRRAA